MIYLLDSWADLEKIFELKATHMRERATRIGNDYDRRSLTYPRIRGLTRADVVGSLTKAEAWESALDDLRRVKFRQVPTDVPLENKDQ
jgi:hypothetical protein